MLHSNAAPIPVKVEYDRIATAVRSTLGKDAFAAAIGTGQRMTLEQAIAYALGGNEGIEKPKRGTQNRIDKIQHSIYA